MKKRIKACSLAVSRLAFFTMITEKAPMTDMMNARIWPRTWRLSSNSNFILALLVSWPGQMVLVAFFSLDVSSMLKLEVESIYFDVLM